MPLGVGGIGLGMVIASACTSSGLWRTGEGNTKIWLAIADYFTWTWTPVFYLAFFIV